MIPTPGRALALGCLLALTLAPAAAAQSALDRLEQLIQTQAQVQPAEPGYLGLIADDRDLDEPGILVIEAIEGGPANAGGLQAGDMILGLDGRRATSMDDLGNILRGSQVGQQIDFIIRRGGQTVQTTVTLGRRPGREDRPYDFGQIPGGTTNPPSTTPPAVTRPGTPVVGGPLLGVRTDPIDADTSRQLGLPSTLGALVVEVFGGSPAEQAGLKVGDCIVALDGWVINEPADLGQAVDRMGPGREVQVSYYRTGRFNRANVVLGSATETSTRVETPVSPGVTRPETVPSPANAPSLEERVRQLEAMVDEMHSRVIELEIRAAQAGRGGSAPGPALPDGRQETGPPTAGPPPPAAVDESFP